MAFPSLTPTARQFDPGDYPIKTFNAQSGAEVRILYGNQRTKMKLSLSFANITDANAELFIDHFDEVDGASRHLTYLMRHLTGGLERQMRFKPPGRMSGDTSRRRKLPACVRVLALLQSI